MMKITVLVLAAMALVCAAPQTPAAPPPPPPSGPSASQPVQIVKQESDVNIDGYNFDFETSDGTSRQEQGIYKNDTEQQGLVVQGSYKYVAPDGQNVAVTFLADRNGYQPQQHLGDTNNQPQA